MYRSTGTIRYSPTMLGNKGQRWWIIVDCDASIGEYYRHLYGLHVYRTSVLMSPAWKEHITIVRHEEPHQKEAWFKHEAAQIEFEYSPNIETNGEYWWLPVVCPRMDEIRKELGLGQPEYPFHLSIGHNKI